MTKFYLLPTRVQAPSSGKLPTLYLVDSILKNVKDPYISLFCRNLIQV